jgi:hypothetical protein
MSTGIESKPDPTRMQIGGDHYTKLAIQPMTYSMANKLDACQHTIIKYVTRFRDKGGVQDLQKARHTLDLLIEYETRVEKEPGPVEEPVENPRAAPGSFSRNSWGFPL